MAFICVTGVVFDGGPLRRRGHHSMMRCTGIPKNEDNRVELSLQE
jgi:hypothetical protein